METCPVCRFSQPVVPVHPAGFFEKLAAKVRFYSYLCTDCRRRFQRFSLDGATGPILTEDGPSPFLEPAQSADFNEIIDQLRKAEERLNQLEDLGRRQQIEQRLA